MEFYGSAKCNSRPISLYEEEIQEQAEQAEKAWGHKGCPQVNSKRYVHKGVTSITGNKAAEGDRSDSSHEAWD